MTAIRPAMLLLCCLPLASAACGTSGDGGDGSTGDMMGGEGGTGGDGSPGDGSPGMDGSGGDGSSGGDAGDAGGGTVVDLGTLPDGAPHTCTVVSCYSHTLECGDCLDNDGDGLVDSDDPGCLGPCDNTEGDGLLPGIGGDTGGPCQSDCYFDFGNGSGNDDCYWDHRCDTLEVAPAYPPEGAACMYDARRVGGRTCPAMQSTMCHDFCTPITPNGCDCFGCCTFDPIHGRSAADGGEWVWIGSVFDGTNTSSCTLADVTDVSLCRPCTPVPDCLNTCDHCELCIGRDTLPPDCFPPPDGGVPDAGTLPDGGTPDGGVYRCAAGVQPCGLPTDPGCGTGYYCVTGCCVFFG